MQDVEFLLEQLDGFAVDKYLPCVGHDFHVAAFNEKLAVLLPSSENAFHAGREFGDVEGLGEVVVGTEVEAGHLVVERVLGRDDDDAGLLVRGFQLAQDVEAVAVGQHDVQKDAVVFIEFGFHHGGFGIGGGLDDMAVDSQGFFHQFPQTVIVLDD